MRNTYWRLCRRGFANEYRIYVVAGDNIERFLLAFPEATRITRKEALWWGITRPAEARRDGEQWYGGLFFVPYGGSPPKNYSDALRICASDTALELELREQRKRITR